MREDTPAPGDQVQPPNVHWAHVVASDEPLEIHVGTGKPITEFMRAVRESELLRTVPPDIAPLCASVLFFMLDVVNYEDYRKSGRLIAWPSRAYLGWHINRQFGHVARALAALKSVGLLRIARPGGGLQTTQWELVTPVITPKIPGAHARHGNLKKET